MVALSARSARAPAPGRRAVRLWLGALILLVFAMVLVGGATRLTESGLSITEWNLVTGTIPPLNQAAWADEFDRYRQSPQYQLANRGMRLAEFRTIFWWEWAHRELGRFIGLVYVAGFLWFAARRAVSAREVAILAAMGLLLGAQGIVGWIMVASGLEPGMTAVAPVRLALHLTLACLFFAMLVVSFVGLGGAVREVAAAPLRWAAKGLVALAFAQIALGGLVAGHDAGLIYNTWPLMDGRLLPSGLGSLQPAWLNLVDNVTTIQFNHRAGACALCAAAVGYLILAERAVVHARGRARLILALALGQGALGVATLVHVVPMGLAMAHQGMALVLLFALVWNASVLRKAG